MAKKPNRNRLQMQGDHPAPTDQPSDPESMTRAALIAEIRALRAARQSSDSATPDEVQQLITNLQPYQRADGKAYLHTDRDVELEIESAKARWISNINVVNQIFDAFKHHMNQVNSAYEQMFIAPLAANWLDVARNCHTTFFARAESAVEAFEDIRQNHPYQHNSDSNERRLKELIETICNNAQQSMQEMGSDLHRAMKEAAASGNSGILSELGKKTSPLAIELYENEARQLATGHIATAPQANRGAMYIGERARQLSMNGIKGREKQRKIIASELRRIVHSLHALAKLSDDQKDQLAAWDYIQNILPNLVKPHDEIGRLEREARQRHEKARHSVEVRSFQDI